LAEFASVVDRDDGTVPRRPADETAAVSAPERRQLTVMFCDLVGSTELSSRKTAKTLGLSIPPPLLAIADEASNEAARVHHDIRRGGGRVAA
jgi:hypothetical protein